MIRVAIDARIPHGFAGGVAQVVTGFAEGFRDAAPEAIERTWITYPGYEDWLGPLIPPQDHVVEVITPVERAGLLAAQRFPRLVSRGRPAVQRMLDSLTAGDRHGGPLDARLHALGIDVVHLPFQDGLPTALPTLYHPHDLQHHHFPEHFTAAQRRHRDTVWRRKALRASAVSVAAIGVAADVRDLWGVEEDQIHIVPLGAGLAGRAPGDAPTVTERPLVLYPAAFWPHKDHLTLVRAIGEVQRTFPVELVLPGAHMGTYPEVRSMVNELGMDTATVLPGYLSDADLSRAYDRASVVVIPSRFEAASFPVWEAFTRAVPVIVANTTALPRQAGAGGIVFEPGDVPALAAVLQRLLSDADLRKRIGQAGLQRVQGFTWTRTALATSALYRKIVGAAPTDREQDALDHAPSF